MTSFQQQPAGFRAPVPDGRLPFRPDQGGPGSGPRLAGRRRRSWPRLAAGLVTVLACVFGFLAAASVVLGRHAVPVLALARAVPAGSPLAPGDLTVVALVPAAGVATVPAGDQADVTGRVAAVPLTAGQLLSQADLGPARFPPAGKAIVALPLGPGAFPPELQPGARVAVMQGPGPAQAATGTGTGKAAAGPGTVLTGVVTGVSPAAASGGGTVTVVSLLVDTAAAQAVEQMPYPVLAVLDPAGTDVP